MLDNVSHKTSRDSITYHISFPPQGTRNLIPHSFNTKASLLQGAFPQHPNFHHLTKIQSFHPFPSPRFVALKVSVNPLNSVDYD